MAVTAELTSNAQHDLVDFSSEDRLRASTGGRSFDSLRWSTPLSRHGDADGRRVLSRGNGRWHAPQPEGLFTYLELYVDDIAYNLLDLDDTLETSAPVLADVSP